VQLDHDQFEISAKVIEKELAFAEAAEAWHMRRRGLMRRIELVARSARIGTDVTCAWEGAMDPPGGIRRLISPQDGDDPMLWIGSGGAWFWELPAPPSGPMPEVLSSPNRSGVVHL
jgi:hypothetical protein